MRSIVINKARAAYILTGRTLNITDALRMYLEDYPELHNLIPLYITSPEIHQMRRILEQIRPRCDECDSELFLQVFAVDPAGRQHPTAWQCKNCGMVYFSELTPAEWLKELRDETRKQNLLKSNEPSPVDMPTGREAPSI